jgi:hypothetical protein
VKCGVVVIATIIGRRLLSTRRTQGQAKVVEFLSRAWLRRGHISATMCLGGIAALRRQIAASGHDPRRSALRRVGCLYKDVDVILENQRQDLRRAALELRSRAGLGPELGWGEFLCLRNNASSGRGSTFDFSVVPPCLSWQVQTVSRAVTQSCISTRCLSM